MNHRVIHQNGVELLYGMLAQWAGRLPMSRSLFTAVGEVSEKRTSCPQCRYGYRQP
jgi:hypothetical protein